jgi:PPM family protein phosphatase
LKGGFAFAQSVGKRGNQEDAAGVIVANSSFATGDGSEQSGSFSTRIAAVICDGMGGHASGDVAANLACQSFLDVYRTDSDGAASPDDRLFSACMSANESIARGVEADRDLKGMGTTFAAVQIRDRTLHWVSVGDSHVLLLRRGRLIKLNQDHSMRPVIEAMVRRGLLTPEDAARHPDRNALRSALMGGPVDIIDRGIGGLALAPGDVLILATDGLDVVAKSVIADRVRPRKFPDLSAQARSVVDQADRVGGAEQDNTTVIIVRLGGHSGGVVGRLGSLLGVGEILNGALGSRGPG